MSFVTQFVWDPPSAEIAARLNAQGREVCDHERDPCITRCGVSLATNGGPHETDCRGCGRWAPVTPERRAQFFGRIVGLWFLRNEEDATRGREVYLGLPGEPAPYEKEHAAWMASWPRSCICGGPRVLCDYHALNRGSRRPR